MRCYESPVSTQGRKKKKKKKPSGFPFLLPVPRVSLTSKALGL